MDRDPIINAWGEYAADGVKLILMVGIVACFALMAVGVAG